MDGEEVTYNEAMSLEDSGAAHLAMGGSGVVPERLRSEGETEAEYLVPWLELRTGEPR